MLSLIVSLSFPYHYYILNISFLDTRMTSPLVYLLPDFTCNLSGGRCCTSVRFGSVFFPPFVIYEAIGLSQLAPTWPSSSHPSPPTVSFSHIAPHTHFTSPLTVLLICSNPPFSFRTCSFLSLLPLFSLPSSHYNVPTSFYIKRNSMSI